MSVDKIRSLAELLRTRAEELTDSDWLVLPEDPTDLSAPVPRRSFGQVLLASEAFAVDMLDRRPQGGDRVVLILPNGAAFCQAFFGALIAGLIPVPLSTPELSADPQEYCRRVGNVLADCDPALIVTSAALAEQLTPAFVGRAGMIVSDEVIDRSLAPPDSAAPADSGATAMIQYTSGSTGFPRGAELSHANLLANVDVMGRAMGFGPGDVVVSWLPLYHDMGLIGTMLLSLYWGLPYVLFSPRAFLFKPQSWLWAISRFKGAMSPAPNFAFQLCTSRIPPEALAGLDLSSWRVANNGSEMVHVSTVEAFLRRFGPVGFRPQTMYPVYGLAEATLAVCFPTLGELPRYDQVDREALETQRRAVPSADEGARSRQIVSVGLPFDGHEVRIVDPSHASDTPLPERCVGEIQTRGPSVMKGYFRNPTRTVESLTAEGWLRTGDLGYQVDGWLYITGRIKDIIKRGGECYDAVDIEGVVNGIPGVRTGCVAAIGLDNHESGTEDLVVLAETRLDKPAELLPLRQEIIHQVRRSHGICPDEVLLLQPRTIPKTTSGKIQHAECKLRYADGRLHRHRAGGDLDSPAGDALQG